MWTCGEEASLSPVMWQPSLGPTVTSPRNARHKLKISANVVADQLRASETVASIGRARHEGPEQQSAAVRRSSAIRKEIISVGWGLSCSASDKIRNGE